MSEDHRGQKRLSGDVLSTTGVLGKSKTQSPGQDVLGTVLDSSRTKAQIPGLDLSSEDCLPVDPHKLCTISGPLCP